ncbi:MAG: hypothetical protein H0X68_03040 [Chloroflexi bacterium]|nr:hypothetical protein [Chloroflexota bacterium]
MKRTVPGLLVLLLTLSACRAMGGAPPAGSPDPSDDDVGIEHTTGDEPIFMIDWQGGYVTVQYMATRTPAFVLYGDGRVIMLGAQTMEYPGPALPPLMQRTLSESGIQAILAEVIDTGMFEADRRLDGAMNVIADANDTVFMLNAGGREVTVSIYGLGTLMADMDVTMISAEELEAHRTLEALNNSLMFEDWLPADAWLDETWESYEADAFRLYVRDVTDQPAEDDGLTPMVRDWPTNDDAAVFGVEQPLFGDGTRCGTVSGEAGATWAPELSTAKQTTTWTDANDRRYSVQARPLLPHEDGACPELSGGA